MTVALLLLWGTAVGLDLVSVSQFMIARPLVAGSVAGLILGDPLAGGLVGAILELFALGVLPVGASRYPDYGLGAVAAANTVAHAPDVLGVGIAVAVGLMIASLGGEAMHILRRRNAADLKRHIAEIDTGDPRALAAVHYRSLARDSGRALLITAIGLLAAEAARLPIANFGGAVLMTVAAIGAGLAATITGGMHLSGRGRDLAWLVAGLLIGTGWIAVT